MGMILVSIIDIDETPQFLLEYSTFDYEDDPRRCD